MKRYALVLLLVFSTVAPLSVRAQACQEISVDQCGSFTSAPYPFSLLLRLYCELLLTTLCDFEY